MSVQAIEKPVDFVPGTTTTEQTTAPTRPVSCSHPRGRGFGVLSRIARVQATEYVPRHRLDVPGDLLVALAG